MPRKTVMLIAFCAFLRVTLLKTTFRTIERKLNIIQSDLSTLKDKVFDDELEFRDEIKSILKQLNNSDHNNTEYADKASHLRNASTKSRHENMEALDKVKAVKHGSEKEKRYIRDQLKMYAGALNEMQEKFKGAILEKTDKRLKDVESNILNERTYTNMIREEMRNDIEKLKQELASELELGSSAIKEMKKTMEELEEKISKNRATLDETLGTVEKLQTAADNIDLSRFLECGSWSRFGLSCYKLFEDEVTWGEAVKNCMSEEAYLVEIDSSEENAMVINLESTEAVYVYDYWYNDNYYNPSKTSTEPWIGASDRKTEGTWIWEYNRRHLTYGNWGDGEPNGGPKENCVHVSEYLGYKWNDISCDERRPYVCEKPVTVK